MVGRCRITSGAHGYHIVAELVQTEDGRLLCRMTNDFSPPLENQPFVPAAAQLDLRAELAALRTAGPLQRPAHRFARLEVRVGDESFEGMFTYPQHGDTPIDHPAERLFNAVFGVVTVTGS